MCAFLYETACVNLRGFSVASAQVHLQSCMSSEACVPYLDNREQTPATQTPAKMQNTIPAGWVALVPDVSASCVSVYMNSQVGISHGEAYMVCHVNMDRTVLW